MMGETLTCDCNRDNVTIESAAKRNTQILEFVVLKLDYSKSQKSHLSHREVALRTNLSAYEYDPETHTLGDVQKWASACGTDGGSDCLVYVLDGKEYRDFEAVFWQQNNRYLAFRYYPTTCRECNKLFFNYCHEHDNDGSIVDAVATFPFYRTYCSDECRIKQNHKRQNNSRRQKRHSNTASVACRHCSCNFIPKRSTARFCSTKCRVAAHRKEVSQQ